MTDRLQRAWSKLPVVVRAAVVAFVILSAGQLPPGVFLAIGLRYTPDVPWWLIATAAWLWIFWRYLDGRWWPASTSQTRHRLLRASPLPLRMWIRALTGGGLGTVAVLTIALLTGLVAKLPAQAYEAPLDLGAYSPLTVVSFFLTIAMMAGVVEEAAFRGYMISMIEQRHGWTIAIAGAALLFYVVHLGHAYATIAFIPFFAAYSLLHGALVYVTRSTVPSVVLHALGDSTILPIQYGVVRSPLGSSIAAHVVVIAVCGGAAVFALWRGRDFRH